MGRQITVEVCLDSLQSARTVQKVAAEFGGRVKWRIELCSNLITGGGLTPSMGLLKSIRKLLPYSEIMVMIRPRVGNFTYSEDEITVMEEDITYMKREGVTGFVFGCLTVQRTIDIPTMTRLCTAAGTLPVTFHRAIDLTNSPNDGIDELERHSGTSNVTRVLTSGGQGTAWEGRHVLKGCMDRSSRNITILPGSGINAGNLLKLLRELPGLTEIHLTASEIFAVSEEVMENETYGSLDDRMAKFGFGANQIWTMNESKIRAVFEIIDNIGKAP